MRRACLNTLRGAEKDPGRRRRRKKVEPKKKKIQVEATVCTAAAGLSSASVTRMAAVQEHGTKKEGTCPSEER